MPRYSVIWRWADGHASRWPVEAPNLYWAVREALSAPAIQDGVPVQGVDIEYRGGWVRFGQVTEWQRLHESTRAVFPLPSWVRSAA